MNYYLYIVLPNSEMMIIIALTIIKLKTNQQSLSILIKFILFLFNYKKISNFINFQF